MEHLLRLLGDPVTDPEEDAFVVFSQEIPSHSLGFIDPNAAQLTVNVAGRQLAIRQSRDLLTSDRKLGTTGAGTSMSTSQPLRLGRLGLANTTAVVWKVTPLFAEWVASPNSLFQAGYLGPNSIAIELGAGISGIVASTLAPKIKKYIVTDQDYVLRLLRQNIEQNLPPPPKATNKKQGSKRKTPQTFADPPASNITALELDWELDSVVSLPALLGQNDSDSDEQGVDVVIACDCIYNEALIEPLNNTCAQICRLRSSVREQNPTLCLIAQQLRSPDVFELWLKSFHRLFHVWTVPDDLLTPQLRENSGFIVHVGLVR